MVVNSTDNNTHNLWYHDNLFSDIPCFSLCLYAFLTNEKKDNTYSIFIIIVP